MAGSDTAPGLSVEVLMKQHVITEVRVLCQFLMVAEHRAPLAPVGQEEPSQAPRELVRNVFDGHESARTSGAFDLEVVAVIMVEFLQRFDDEKVHRHPDRPAPVGVAAEKA